MTSWRLVARHGHWSSARPNVRLMARVMMKNDEQWMHMIRLVVSYVCGFRDEFWCINIIRDVYICVFMCRAANTWFVVQGIRDWRCYLATWLMQLGGIKTSRSAYEPFGGQDASDQFPVATCRCLKNFWQGTTSVSQVMGVPLNPISSSVSRIFHQKKKNIFWDTPFMETVREEMWRVEGSSLYSLSTVKSLAARCCHVWKQHYLGEWQVTGWWFGTFNLFFCILIGKKKKPTDELRFSRGVAQPPTRSFPWIIWQLNIIVLSKE